MSRAPTNRRFQRHRLQSRLDGLGALIKTIESEGRAYRKEEQDEDRGKKRREWITIILIALTFAAVCYQVYEMIKVYEPIKEQAEASKIAADAATTQSEIATKQSENSERALVQAQRAWVGPSNVRIDGTVEIGRPISIVVDYTNSGKEPALNFVPAIDFFQSTAEEDAGGAVTAKINAYFRGCKDVTSLRPGQVIFPNAGNSFTLKTKDDFVDQSLLDGNSILIVDGCLLYKSFDVIRHTYFCYFFNNKTTKPSNLNICSTGAGAD
jgi:hypothetical protein